ncbi:hypothetical protein ACFWY5_52230 [Nonomuraea sp. NPDC059007]|uniref:hypothetical protein n=1 Tax=Nonomuraea sp. NPDC059007 TaxID=3346692 RepID=UPI0036AD008D
MALSAAPAGGDAAEKLAQHDDLRRYVEGGDVGLLARTQEMLLERAALARIPDLDARVATLSGRAQETYRIGVAARGNDRRITLSPKQTIGAVSIIPHPSTALALRLQTRRMARRCEVQA